MRVFGFPVKVRAGFGIFMLLIIALNGLELGLWLAGSIAVFTLAHELGHALAARRTGSEASISLDFMAGYASFVPTRPLSRRERALISAAGPMTQITLGLLVLIVIGVNPFDHQQFAAGYATLAIWWAGPIIGVFNLIPVLPLDGGNIASEAIDYFVPGRGRSLMGALSIPLTAGAFAFMVLDPNLRPMAAFAGLLLVLQVQIRAAERAADRVAFPPSRHPAAVAEDLSWRTGRAHIPHDPFVLSPWWEAHTLAVTGNPAPGVPVLADLRNTDAEQKVWWPPVAASVEQLEAVVSALPRPLPLPTTTTPSRSALSLLDVLRRTEHFDDAITYGTSLYSVQPSADVAIELARCLVHVDQPDLAVEWLSTAARQPESYDHLRLVIGFLPDFQLLNERRDFQELIAQLSSEN
ncbi:MAG: metalloprotease [Actinomycetota bacterium]